MPASPVGAVEVADVTLSATTSAIRIQARLRLGDPPDAPTTDVLLYLPAAARRRPVPSASRWSCRTSQAAVAPRSSAAPTARRSPTSRRGFRISFARRSAPTQAAPTNYPSMPTCSLPCRPRDRFTWPVPSTTVGPTRVESFSPASPRSQCGSCLVSWGLARRSIRPSTRRSATRSAITSAPAVTICSSMTGSDSPISPTAPC